MEKINFEDGITKGNATTFNQMQKNIEEEINSLIENINKAKTVTFNGEWLNGVSGLGGGTSLRIPIFNPTNTQPSLINLSGEYYSSTNGWVSLENIAVRVFGSTYVELSFDTGLYTEGVLIKLFGTIQAQ